MTLGDAGWVEPNFEYKNRFYYNSDDYPTATDQTGNLFTYAVNSNGQFSERFGVLSRLAFNQNYAAAKHLSYDQYLASLSFDLRFDVFEWEGWALQPFASLSYTDYKGIAPTEVLIGSKVIREDIQWNAGATLEIPMMDTLGVSVLFKYTQNDSNLDRFTYKNLQVMSGPIVRF